MAGDDADTDDGDENAEGSMPASGASIQRGQPEFEFDDIAPAPAPSPAPDLLPAAVPAPAAATAIDAVGESSVAGFSAPDNKTPADIAAEVIGEVQPTAAIDEATDSVVTTSGEIAPAVAVDEEAVEPVVVPAPEPVGPEVVGEVVVDPLTETADDSSPLANSLHGGHSAGVSAEVEPASTALVSIDEESAAAANSQLPASELPRTAGLFDDVPQPAAPSPADAAANAAEPDNDEQRA